MTPALTVAVCARDDPHRLALCLEGIALQVQAWEDVGVEVVVINDGGPSLEDVLRPFAGRMDLRADRLEPPSNKYRLAAARNLALRHARAERVLFLDQDSVVRPGVLAAHASYGGAAVVVAGVRHHLARSEVAALVPADVPELAARSLRPDQRLAAPWFQEASGRLVPMSAFWVTGCHVSVPTAMLRDIGGYWEEFVGWGHEDTEMAMRLGRAGCALAVRADLAVVHLDHPSRINRSSLRRNRFLLARTQRNPESIRRGLPLEPLP